MNIKYSILLAVISVISSLNYATAECEGKVHDLILGSNEAGARLLDTIHEKTGSFILKKQVRDVVWPLRGQNNTARITKIEVLDQKKNNKGGCACLTGGGVGTTSLKLHLKSRLGGSFDFLIKIYGK